MLRGHWAFCAFLLVPFAFPQTAGQIEGIVKDDSGKPAAGAFAVATEQSASDHSTHTAVSGKNGDYSLDNLRPGTYTVCVQKPGGVNVNACQWSASTQFAKGKGESLTGRSLPVVEGALLQIRVSDPGKLLAASDDLLVGVFLPTGLFPPMRLA